MAVCPECTPTSRPIVPGDNGERTFSLFSFFFLLMITGGAWNFHDLNLSWFEHNFYAYIFKAYISRSKQAKKKGTYSAQLHKSKKSTSWGKLKIPRTQEAA